MSRSRSRSPRGDRGSDRERGGSDRAASRKDSPPRGYQGNDPTKIKRTIFVAGLAAEVNEKDVRKLFQSAGFPASEVSIPFERQTGRHRGYGFVCLEQEEDIDAACDKLNGDTLRGREIKCEPKNPELRKGPPGRRFDDRGKGGYGFGGYGGKGGYGGGYGRGRGRGDSRRRRDSRRRGDSRRRKDSRRRR